MMLRGIHLCVLYSIHVVKSFSISDISPSRIFVSLFAFYEADPLTGSVTLFLFVKIVAVVVAWDMPDWRAITIIDFPLSGP